jgi:hypothetical protein
MQREAYQQKLGEAAQVLEQAPGTATGGSATDKEVAAA